MLYPFELRALVRTQFAGSRSIVQPDREPSPCVLILDIVASNAGQRLAQEAADPSKILLSTFGNSTEQNG
jgi:hypothetical protein